MHKPSLVQLVFGRLFPGERSSDPPRYEEHIRRNLVPEVRAETTCFYGPINCVEAQFPGLDYASEPHQLRLGRFPWHRKLFRIFKEMRLTDSEIRSLCKWEGTRWARERYERDTGSRINDTTWDEVTPWIPLAPSITRTPLSEPFHQVTSPRLSEEAQDDESEDVIQQSVGLELNERLVVATEARNRGEDAILDPDWEQWLKEAAERESIGQTPDMPGLDAAGHIPAVQTIQSRLLPWPGDDSNLERPSPEPITGTAI
ncbi:MAG: hypothetical protein LQ351_001104 [Letrouitia transgressa]|nr:MAG: hypothetical protein LQ351_001104 [Letrouitia transgressa]